MKQPTADQQARFAKLDHDIAEAILLLGERYDVDKLDDLTEIAAWETPEQYLNWFLQFIQSGFFTRRQSLYIRSALSRKHPMETPAPVPAKPESEMGGQKPTRRKRSTTATTTTNRKKESK